MQKTFRLSLFGKTAKPAAQPVSRPAVIDSQLLKLVAGGVSTPVPQVVEEEKLPKGGW